MVFRSTYVLSGEGDKFAKRLVLLRSGTRLVDGHGLEIYFQCVSMNATYYIPLVYEEESGACDATDLIKARAECLISFYCEHPEAVIIVGPIFGLTDEDEKNR